MDRNCPIYAKKSRAEGQARLLVSYWVAAFPALFFSFAYLLKISGENLAQRVATFMWAFSKMKMQEIPFLTMMCSSLNYALTNQTTFV
jgi:hypothetical protein